jgi:hypothetical protein
VSAIEKLTELGSDSFLPKDVSIGLSGLERFGTIGSELADLFKKKNGFFCFDQSLRFFPSATVDPSWGIHDWNRRDLWKDEYQGLADGVFCFAEDIFGNQFCIVENEIRIFDVETGDTEKFAVNLENWAEKILTQSDLLSGAQFAREWKVRNGQIPFRHRLIPKRPFVLGGEYNLSNLDTLDSVRIMKNMGNMAHQIHDLPDGTKVQFKIL